MINIIQQIAGVCGYITCIITALSLVIKPVRKKIFGFSETQESIKCILRTLILQTYYKCRESKTIYYYELENVLKLYEAYKEMGGNSFIKEVIEEIKSYTVE